MGDFVANLARWRYKLILFVSLVVLCINCIDPYTPNIGKFRSLLVVDALITDEDAPNYVKLSWTTRVEGEDKRAGDALVVISDDSGNSVTLTEKEKGEYWTDPATFRGEVGKSYTLSVVAANGEEYRSNSCLMYPVNEIDSLYYTYHEAVPKGYLDYYEGVNIYADTPAESASGYRRWTYDEWWKFRIPYPSRLQYMDYEFIDKKPENEICWSNIISKEIDIYADLPLNRRTLEHPVLFLPSELSNRFQFKYYIEVKQLSISREEYGFWSSMKLLNETGGNIFDRQPYPLYGNVKNVNDPSRNAVGYFQVSSVSSKRIYITADDIDNLGLPKYKYECDLFTASVNDFFDLPVTLVFLYHWAVHNGYSLFIRANEGFVMVLSHCADCTLNGQLDPPDFWEDL